MMGKPNRPLQFDGSLTVTTVTIHTIFTDTSFGFWPKVMAILLGSRLTDRWI